MKYDSNAKYLKSHEWARQEGDLIVCGISDYAQDSLSDVVYVELPEVGATLASGDIFGVVESVKAASDLYLPMGGEIVEVNEALIDAPETINADPFGAGWMIKVRPSTPSEWDALLDAEAYQAAAEAE
ncbi:MAG: glycine cleavage system protein GcvH [Caldilineaceae bacterium]|nr:glycine cleavage system protein GcvH [Caldilineaceae bacterium]